MQLAVEVFISDVSGEDVEGIRKFWQPMPVDLVVRSVSARRSYDLIWTILIVLPWKAFLDKVFEEFATDSYRQVKKTLAQMIGQSPEPGEARKPVVIRDSASGIEIVLEHDLPPESLDLLMDLDLSSFRRGPLHYDRRRKRWRSESNAT
jgi:hypothetical protein